MNGAHDIAGIASEVRDTLVDMGMKYRLRLRPQCTKGYMGAFIVLEGIDGSGTSTHSHILYRVLDGLSVGRPKPIIVYTGEPSRRWLGNYIRSVISGFEDEDMINPVVMSLLFASDRMGHLILYPPRNSPSSCRGVIKCMARPGIVVSDRYKYSSLVYQSLDVDGYDGVDEDWIAMINSYAPPPHILIYIDAEPGDAHRGILDERGYAVGYEDPDFLSRARTRYREILERLVESPEWPVEDSNPRWVGLVERLIGELAECVYPAGPSYPIVEVVSRGDNILDTAVDIAVRTVRGLKLSGVVEFVS